MVDYSTMLQEMSDIVKSYAIPEMITTLVICLALTFFAYKIYRIVLRPLYAFTAGWLAYLFIPKYLPLDNIEVPGINLLGLAAILLALVAALIAPYIHRFVSCAFIGYLLGCIPASLLGIEDPIQLGVILIVFALVCALLFRKIFKGLTIITSSLGGTLASAYAIIVVVFSDTVNYYLKESFIQTYTAQGATMIEIEDALAAVGLANVQAPTNPILMYVICGLMLIGSIIVSIFAIKYQFKTNKDN